jgi:hypothetical protein
MHLHVFLRTGASATVFLLATPAWRAEMERRS